MSVAASKRVAVIGAGPAGLMAADVISAAGVDVTLYERMPSAGRKLLMAGRGGLNLTHGEPLEPFLARYGDRASRLRAAIEAFPPEAVRAWAEDLGQATFAGSSGRVFPRAMKASPLLRAWLKRLGARGVMLETRHRWLGWNASGELLLESPDGAKTVTPAATVLALGGASWAGLGSDGSWQAALGAEGVAISPLVPSNCGFDVAWSSVMRERFEGQPLKRIALTHGAQTVRGEIIISARGIEGGAIYALSASLRTELAARGEAQLVIDLRPDIESAALVSKLQAPRGKQSLSSFLRKAAQLDPVAIGLLQEHAHNGAVPLGTLDPAALASLIKAVPIRLTGSAPIDRAISTAGGVDFDALDANFMLTRRPGTFLAGEMLDWDAPTGGYLLQACLSTGAAAGRGVLGWLGARSPGG